MNRLGSIETLIYRSFKSFSNDGNFHWEIQTLKSILKHNNCPQNFVNQCFKKFLNKLFIKEDLIFICRNRFNKL